MIIDIFQQDVIGDRKAKTTGLAPWMSSIEKSTKEDIYFSRKVQEKNV